MSAPASETRRSASDAIYDDLRNDIVRLVLEPGSFIYESALATKHGASRTPVRQAFARLERDHLLEVIPQRGARVAPLSVRAITEAQTVRESLEITAIGELATQWDRDDLRFRLIGGEIEHNLDQQTRAAHDRDSMAFVGLDSAFHSLLMNAAGNSTLQRCVESVRLHLQRLRYLELEFMRHEHRSVEQHREIIAAVIDNDITTSRAVMADHLALVAEVRETIYSRRSDIFED